MQCLFATSLEIKTTLFAPTEPFLTRKCRFLGSVYDSLLQGDRQLKKLARKLRDEADEEHKKEIDLEEKKYQAQKRKEAIEKAKSDQYFESDRLKAFRV